MTRIAVVTDTAACISPEMVKKYDIRIAPLHIIIDGEKEYRDGVDLDTNEFYIKLRKMGKNEKLPTTSSAIPGEFLPIFESLRGKVDGVVVAVMSSAIAGCYNSANQAKELVTGLPIEVIDTKTAMSAEAFCVEAAAKKAAAGGTLEQVAQALRDMIPRVHLFWIMETLEYLRRGGRVSMPAAMLAGWLKVKPLLSLDKDGKVIPVGKPRTMTKAIDAMLDQMGQLVKSTPIHAAIMHGDAGQNLEILKNKLVSRFNPVELDVRGMTPVIGTHTGPGTMAIAFYNE
jgi:DegV family protein with EDD domain